MAEDIEDLPAVNSISTIEYRQESELENKRQRAKRRDELIRLEAHKRGIDDVIEYLQDLYFPKSNGIDIARPATIAPQVDLYFLQAQEQIQGQHNKTMESSIRFLCYMNGWDIFKERYKKEIEHCETLYRAKSNSADMELYNIMRKSKLTIKQDTYAARPETGFTPTDRELIQTLAKWLGISDTGLLVVFFWVSAVGSNGIMDHLKEHGKEIEASFELQFKLRVHNLGFKR
jgi:hypothetical protein